jgi:N6-L-threonylcarbamoyladenine synthase
VLAHRVAGQEAEHRPYGGVVPEIAARAHAEALTPLIEAVFRDAGPDAGLMSMRLPPPPGRA